MTDNVVRVDHLHAPSMERNVHPFERHILTRYVAALAGASRATWARWLRTTELLQWIRCHSRQIGIAGQTVDGMQSLGAVTSPMVQGGRKGRQEVDRDHAQAPKIPEEKSIGACTRGACMGISDEGRETMSDWHRKTRPLAERAIEIRSRLAEAAMARARAHLEICDAQLAAFSIQKEAIAVLDEARQDGRADFIEASIRTWDLVTKVGDEASDLVAMMRIPA